MHIQDFSYFQHTTCTLQIFRFTVKLHFDAFQGHPVPSQCLLRRQKSCNNSQCPHFRYGDQDDYDGANHHDGLQDDSFPTYIFMNSANKEKNLFFHYLQEC